MSEHGHARVAILKRDAIDSANWRGHAMGAWTDWRSPLSTCATCGAEVHVTPEPMPNEIDIAGSAVALNCPAR